MSIAHGDLILFQSETILPQLSSASVEPNVRATSLEGTWETLADVALYLRFYTTDFPLTEAGVYAQESYDEPTMSPALDCIPYSSPLLMIDPDFKRIVVEDDRVTIQGGFAPAERVIHLNTTTHDEATPSAIGRETPW